jgi:peptidoglycan hydrolase CwlO-like protein
MIVELKKRELEENKKEEIVSEMDENKSIITGAMEKIGILEKEVEEEKEEKKSLNQRIEDLVNQIEKTNKLVKTNFSFKSIFLKGLLQGLGIIIGSTILAGLLYSLSTKFIDKDFIKENTLKYILDQEK